MTKTSKRRQAPKAPKKSTSSTNVDRPKPHAHSTMRDKTTVKRLQMYKSGGKAIRNAAGKVVKAAPFQTRATPGEVARVAPNRKWFGNTRVITQNALQTFQEEMGKVMKDPYKVVMRKTKLPLSLLDERAQSSRVHILDTEGFDTTFGPKAQRKRPNIKVSDMQGLAEMAQSLTEKYNEENDKDLVREDLDERPEAKESIYSKGQSKRIWNELYKVVDSSDVILQVLDARDPLGTRSKHIETFIKKEKSHKHLIFILNKCDLVPTWVTQQWVSVLSEEHPTLAFHASVTNPFGKGALINLLRQFSKLHSDKKQISVGLIGYPNVGKSSIINTLKAKKVCKVAPIAGETKVWQYITLMRRIYLVDCPGVVYPTGDTETEIILKGVVRVENVKEAAEHIPTVLERVKREYLAKTYRVQAWDDCTDFLEQVSRRSGKLLKGGEPDINTVAKMILNDFQRGKLPYFVAPPKQDGDTSTNPESNKSAKIPPLMSSFVKAKDQAENASDDNKKENDDRIVNRDCPMVDKAKDIDNSTATSKREHPESLASKKDSFKNTSALQVRQDFSAIHVAPDFAGDDVRPLEEISGVDAEQESDDEEESRADSKDEAVEKPGEDSEEDAPELIPITVDASEGNVKDLLDVSEWEELRKAMETGEIDDSDEEEDHDATASADDGDDNDDDDDDDIDYEYWVDEEEEKVVEEEEGEKNEQEYSADENESEVVSETATPPVCVDDKIWTSPTSQRYAVSVSPFVTCVEAIDSDNDREIGGGVHGTPKNSNNNSKSSKTKKGYLTSKNGGKQTKRISDESEDEDSPGRKKKRMTTNKQRVGSNYYAAANVKNKNRNRSKEKTSRSKKRGKKNK
ncbi:nucleolar GTP-binding protein 2 [Nematostella vectensis]|uniref:nucleolar GTP-binding protein 2 n=1 Tax=Nematostella vectensis TaxID=45351 RepID=UPI00207783E0|nr:nucleolar GTP-binding protein 2 [Nematostella vectensis]